MADIELVVKIDEDLYEMCKDCLGTEDDVAGVIANGTLLPNGHGDLKDMDDIYEALERWDDDTGWIVDAIDYQAPTIIKADKRSEE